MNFRIENSQIAIFFPRIQSIRRMVFDLEEHLSSRFQRPFTMAQVPDGAPEEIPRIQANSINGHTSLTISQSSIILVTNFNNGFEHDWSKSNEYLIKNFELIYSIASFINAKSLLYSGFTVNLFFPFNSEMEVMSHIGKVFFPEKKIKNLHEFNVRFVQKIEEFYFVNYMLASTVKYVSQGFPIRPVPAYLIASEYGITLSIDINDRYGSNFLREYISSPNCGNKLMDFMNDVILSKVNILMEKGDLNI
jgi:hypothetical protein